MSTFLLLLWKKNERNLKNIFWTHAIRTTTLLTPKFWPTPILWTYATHAKISNYTTHAKISTHVTYAIFLTHAKILQTHATHAKVWTKRPMLPTHPRYPCHRRDLADSMKSIDWKLRICSHLLKKSLTKNLIFCLFEKLTLLVSLKKCLNYTLKI